MGGGVMVLTTARVAPEKQFHRLPAAGHFCDAMEMDVSPEQIKIVERLRAAAKEHGEVCDLLVVLRDSFVAGAFIGSQEECKYLSAAMLAADFAEHDREEVAGRV